MVFRICKASDYRSGIISLLGVWVCPGVTGSALLGEYPFSTGEIGPDGGVAYMSACGP